MEKTAVNPASSHKTWRGNLVLIFNYSVQQPSSYESHVKSHGVIGGDEEKPSEEEYFPEDDAGSSLIAGQTKLAVPFQSSIANGRQ